MNNLIKYPNKERRSREVGIARDNAIVGSLLGFLFYER